MHTTAQQEASCVRAQGEHASPVLLSEALTSVKIQGLMSAARAIMAVDS